MMATTRMGKACGTWWHVYHSRLGGSWQQRFKEVDFQFGGVFELLGVEATKAPRNISIIERSVFTRTASCLFKDGAAFAVFIDAIFVTEEFVAQRAMSGLRHFSRPHLA